MTDIDEITVDREALIAVASEVRSFLEPRWIEALRHLRLIGS